MRFKRSEKIIAALVITVFLVIAGVGAVWLAGVIHWTPTGWNISQAKRSPPAPQLASIPWRLDWRHPLRRMLFPATVPNFRRPLAIPRWWGRGGEQPTDSLLAGLCQPSGATARKLQARALAHVKHIFRRRDWRQINRFRSVWLPALLRAGRYRLAGRLCRSGILAQPAITGWLQFLMYTRAQCFLARHEPDRALITAVRLFNVCSMRFTGEALLLAAQCMRQGGGAAAGIAPGARTKPPSVTADIHFGRYFTAPGKVDEFIAEQVQGAKTGHRAPRQFPLPRYFADLAARNETAMVDSANVMARLKIPPDPYLARAAHVTGEDFYSLLSRGNLYLLANRPQLAVAVFTRAYELANGWEILQAEESIARTVKAWTKTIGPANRWVYYVRNTDKHEFTRIRTK